MDYPALLKALHALGLDLPLMLEHMSDPQADVLGEPLTWRVVLGAGMITIGTLVLIRWPATRVTRNISSYLHTTFALSKHLLNPLAL